MPRRMEVDPDKMPPKKRARRNVGPQQEDALGVLVRELGIDWDTDAVPIHDGPPVETAAAPRPASPRPVMADGKVQADSTSTPVELQSSSLVASPPTPPPSPPPPMPGEDDLDEENVVDPPEGMELRPRGVLCKQWGLNKSRSKMVEMGLDLHSRKPYILIKGNKEGENLFFGMSWDELIVVMKSDIMNRLRNGFNARDRLNPFDVGGIEFSYKEFQGTTILILRRTKNVSKQISLALGQTSVETLARMKDVITLYYFKLMNVNPMFNIFIEYFSEECKKLSANQDVKEVFDMAPFQFYKSDWDPVDANLICSELYAFHVDYFFNQ